MREISSTGRILHSVPKNQCNRWKSVRCCLRIQRRSRPLNMPPLSLPACGQLSMPALLQAAGPAGANDDVRPATCQKWRWRQGGAGAGPGGTCHVSPGQGCRHSEVVFFDKYFQRWSFLTLRWRRWSYVSKIRSHPKKNCILVINTI
jgi:hypothetical protein